MCYIVYVTLLLGVLQCWMCYCVSCVTVLVYYNAGCVTLLGVLLFWVCYSIRGVSVGCVTEHGVLQCWVCYSAGCVTMLGVL